jgi:AraC-like DNA-binding protein
MTAATAATDLVIELTPVEHLLMRTPLVALGEFRCPTDHPQFRGGGPQACAYVVFPRTAVRISPHRGRPEVCTPALAVYYNVGDSYERHAVGNQGDCCDWMAVSQTLLRELIGDDASESSRPGFAGAFSPIASRHFLAQRGIFDRLSSQQNLSTLEIEEEVVPLLQQVHAEANRRWTREGGKGRSPRPATERERRRIVNDVRQVIAVNFTEDWSLSDLAETSGCSPGHLARSFRALTGTSLHEYRNQLRLRAALTMLPDFRHNLSMLALELGFANHSHFGEAFRRHFGLTPSDYACRPHLNRARS